MRKFRGWNKSTKEMYYQKPNERLTKGIYISESGAREYLSNIIYGRHYICMEYIGIKDDEGLDIYYNDIVSFEISDEEQIIKGTGLVVFNNGAGLLFDIKSMYENIVEVFYDKTIEIEEIIELKNIISIKVIGNIFQK